jgi:hypothetical protein
MRLRVIREAWDGSLKVPERLATNIISITIPVAITQVGTIKHPHRRIFL